MKAKSSPDFRSILQRLSHRRDLHTVFDTFIRLAACALAVQTRETEYLETIKDWEIDELNLFAEALGALIAEMESKPFEDILGGYYMEFALSTKRQQHNGEFHTPKPVCDLMAQIVMGDPVSLPKEGVINICEPACGSGAMILSIGHVCPPETRRRLRVTAIDISRTACDMAFINTTLWGIPTRVIHGDSLAMKYWAAWSNLYYLAPWLPLALRKQSPEAMEQGQPPKPAEVERIKTSLGQQKLAL